MPTAPTTDAITSTVSGRISAQHCAPLAGPRAAPWLLSLRAQRPHQELLRGPISGELGRQESEPGQRNWVRREQGEEEVRGTCSSKGHVARTECLEAAET